MRLKLILAFIFIVILTIVTTLFISYRQTAQEVSSFVSGGGLSGTQQVVITLERYYQVNGSWEGAEEILNNPRRGQGTRMGPFRRDELSHVPVPDRLQLIDADGRVFYDTAGETTGVQLSPIVIDRAIPLEVRGEIVGYLLSPGAVPALPEIATTLTSRIRNLIVTSGMISLGISLVLALFVANQLIRPIQRLTKAAKVLGQGDLSHRVPVKGGDEVAVLGNTFNEMAASLQKAETRRKAMTADIAHELRTPLSVQRAHLEAMIDGVYPMDAEHISPIIDQNLLLSRLVEDLRTIALADAGQINLEKTPTDLAALLSRVVERFDAQAVQDEIVLKLDVQENCPTIFADPQRLEQIFNNLLSNALRFTPRGGSVTVDLKCSANQVVISVRDNGPGIPEHALAHVFDRFYKADYSRSRSNGGTGLGLSIAKKLALSHGGDLTATNHPAGGALFTLSLPVQS